MLSVTLAEVKSWRPCWLKDKNKSTKLEKIGGRKDRWTAIDVLNLPEDEVSAEDKLWVVLRPELVPDPILHEFACWCAEEALKLVENPDPRSIAAIDAKRRWLRGEISDEELDAASAAAWDAWDVAWDAASAAAWDAARDAARDAAWDAASDVASDVARYAARYAVWDAVWAAAWDAARRNQIGILRELLA